jgi:hypothetical protein
MALSAADLLAAEDLVVDVEIPSELLSRSVADDDRRVRLKPLIVNDLRLIARAARTNDELTAVLMVQRALVEPALSVAEVSRMPAGLLQFLLRRVNDISGISASDEEIARAIEDPLAQAAFRLSQCFGWTPEEIGKLTIGDVLLHLQLLKAA